MWFNGKSVQILCGFSSMFPFLINCYFKIRWVKITLFFIKLFHCCFLWLHETRIKLWQIDAFTFWTAVNFEIQQKNENFLLFFHFQLPFSARIVSIPTHPHRLALYSLTYFHFTALYLSSWAVLLPRYPAYMPPTERKKCIHPCSSSLHPHAILCYHPILTPKPRSVRALLSSALC